MHRIEVGLGNRSYPVTIGPGALSLLEGIVFDTGCSLAVLITDENVDDALGEKLFMGEITDVVKLVVPAGEGSKTLGVAQSLLDRMAKARVRRTDLVVALGGGMVGDLAGFVASIFQRGIPFVNVPTSLLAQVDAAIGGKTGVNLEMGKNLVGTFYQPAAVICDTLLLETLPQRELRSGTAEILKYGFCFNPELLSFQETAWDEVVRDCVAIKARVVAADETDKSLRIVLNYGHTVGHALETAGRYEQLRHGEAVAAGMMFAARLAANLGMISDDVVALHEEAIKRAGLPTRARFSLEEVLEAMKSDKKHGEEQAWVLLEAIGSPVVRTGIPNEVVRQTLEEIRL